MIHPKQRTPMPPAAALELTAYLARRAEARKLYEAAAAVSLAEGLPIDPFEYFFTEDEADLSGYWSDDPDVDRRIWDEIDLHESMAESNRD